MVLPMHVLLITGIYSTLYRTEILIIKLGFILNSTDVLYNPSFIVSFKIEATYFDSDDFYPLFYLIYQNEELCFLLSMQALLSNFKKVDITVFF